MKAIEKQKAQLIIDRIESGKFDLNDIDNLLMKLRAFSGTCKVFKDVAHFVAHNDERDTGLAKDKMEAMYLRMKFFALYRSVKNIDFRRPFPTWIKRTLKFQLELLDEETIKKQLGKNKNQVQNILNRSFKDNNKTGNTEIKKYNEQIFQVIRVLLGWIINFPVYTAEQFIEEFLKVLDMNKIKYSPGELLLQKDKILISVLLLFHKTKFLLKDGNIGHCTLEVDNETGTLGCAGIVPFDYPGKKYWRLGFPVFSTELKADAWLDFPISPSKSFTETIKVSEGITKDLCVSEDFKIGILQVSDT